jgi:hypothetical protein
LSAEWWALLQEKPRRSDARLLQQQGVPSGESSKVPKRSRKHPADDARAKNPLSNHAKLVHAPAASRKRQYRVDRRQQNHTKDRELGDDRNRRGLLGNALAVAANGVSRSIRERLAVAHHWQRRFLEQPEEFEDDHDNDNHSNDVKDVSVHAGDSYQSECAVASIIQTEGLPEYAAWEIRKRESQHPRG